MHVRRGRTSVAVLHITECLLGHPEHRHHITSTSLENISMNFWLNNVHEKGKDTHVLMINFMCPSVALLVLIARASHAQQMSVIRSSGGHVYGQCVGGGGGTQKCTVLINTHIVLLGQHWRMNQAEEESNYQDILITLCTDVLYRHACVTRTLKMWHQVTWPIVK